MKLLNNIKDLFREKHVWDKFYPKDKRRIEVPDMSLYEFIYERNKMRQTNIAINYFSQFIIDISLSKNASSPKVFIFNIIAWLPPDVIADKCIFESST